MNHEEFVRRTKNVLDDKLRGSVDDALTKLRELLQDLKPAVKDGVNDWHQQQTLSLLVEILDATGRKAECESAWNELIQFNKAQLKYWEIALTTATEQFESWKS